MNASFDLNRLIRKTRLSLAAAVALTTVMGLGGCRTAPPAVASADAPPPSQLRSIKALRPGFQQGKITVRAIQGRAWIAHAGDEWRPLQVGEIARVGAVIRVAPESHADIFLGRNGPVLRADSDTIFAINALGFKETGAGTLIDTEFYLARGRIIGNTKKLLEGSRYEVITPAGSAKIKEGT